MKKVLITLVLAGTFISSNALADSAPLSMHKEYVGQLSGLRVTSIAAGVEVKRVELNEGECQDGNIKLNLYERSLGKGFKQRALPHLMKYGEKRLVQPDGVCNIMKATFYTNKGDWTWTFN